MSARFLSRLLLLIVGLTVLSPHFGWEVAAADADHGAFGTAPMHAVHDHPDGRVLSDHHGEHACGGHMFGHMPAQASSERLPALVAGRDAFPASPSASFPSRDPESPERPPRVHPF